MKVTVNIEKRYAYVIIGLLAIGLVAIFVNAYGTSNPSNFGHTLSELDHGVAINCLDDQSNSQELGAIYTNYCGQMSNWFGNVSAPLTSEEKERAVAISSWSWIAQYVADGANVCYAQVLSGGDADNVPNSQCVQGYKSIFRHFSRCGQDNNRIVIGEITEEKCNTWFELCCK